MSYLTGLRTAQKLKVEEIAARLGTTPQYWHMIVNGERMPGTERIFEIARIFNVSAERVFFEIKSTMSERERSQTEVASG